MMRILIAVLLAATAAHAQTQNVEVEPVTCWWRTSAPSVRVGESFDVVLTCALLETEAARVVADQSRLEPPVVQLPPFEVTGGSRAKDLTTASRRFVQYTYRLRVVAEHVFASEVAVPPLELTYRIESRVGAADAVAGRDLTYALPPLTMRVLSLVPDSADDIREAPVRTMADIETAASRGTLMRVAAAAAVVVGVLLLLLALARTLRRRQAAKPASERAMTGAAVLGSARRELEAVREQVRSSAWTADLAGRALAALRIVAAYASRRPVAQRAAMAGVRPADGQLVVDGRTGPATLVSAAVTGSDDEPLREALARFTAAHYGREARFDGQLDDALDAAIARAAALAAARPFVERLWAR